MPLKLLPRPRAIQPVAKKPMAPQAGKKSVPPAPFASLSRGLAPAEQAFRQFSKSSRFGKMPAEKFVQIYGLLQTQASFRQIGQIMRAEYSSIKRINDFFGIRSPEEIQKLNNYSKNRERMIANVLNGLLIKETVKLLKTTDWPLEKIAKKIGIGMNAVKDILNSSNARSAKRREILRRQNIAKAKQRIQVQKVVAMLNEKDETGNYKHNMGQVAQACGISTCSAKRISKKHTLRTKADNKRTAEFNKPGNSRSGISRRARILLTTTFLGKAELAKKLGDFDLQNGRKRRSDGEYGNIIKKALAIARINSLPETAAERLAKGRLLFNELAGKSSEPNFKTISKRMAEMSQFNEGLSRTLYADWLFRHDNDLQQVMRKTEFSRESALSIRKWALNGSQ